MFWIVIAGVVSGFIAPMGAQDLFRGPRKEILVDGKPVSLEVREQTEKSMRRFSTVCLIAGLAGLAGVVFWYNSYTDPDKVAARAQEYAERNAREQCESRTGANLIAREFVKDRLKAPSTAKFASYSESRVESAGECTFTVQSHVDAQNGFGANTRTRYTAIVEYIPGADRWQLISLSLE